MIPALANDPSIFYTSSPFPLSALGAGRVGIIENGPNTGFTKRESMISGKVRIKYIFGI